MIRLLIVDDHIPTRQAAAKQLAAGGVINIVGEASTSDEGLLLAEQLLPDLVLLDLHLPGLINTRNLIGRLKSLKNVKVVIYASSGKLAEVKDLLDAGASAYILKSDPIPLIRMTLLMVSKGSRGIISPSLPHNLTRLSTYEQQLLREIAKRGGVAKAAQRMSMPEASLLSTLESLAHKLQLQSIDHLVKWAKKQGF